ncbi:MAG: CDP-glycerol glycerophosphotransferase family protein [Anaerovoracaceae bacterium]
MGCVVRILKMTYWGMKKCKVRNKVTFISRQTNSVTLDFSMISNCLLQEYSCVEIKMLAMKLEGSIFHKIRYAFHMIRQMYHIATSKVVVLDGYCIVASVLDHKEGTKIIQLWHALCAIKKFGCQTLDTEEGSSSQVAQIMRMHENYDLVMCASEATAAFYEKSFNVSRDKIKILGMPRVDVIKNPKNKNEEILGQYPEFAGKKTILYIPTFRKNEGAKVDSLIKGVDREKYNLLIKLHPLDLTQIDKTLQVDRKYGTYDLLKFADYIITDYSAVSVEASILDKPVFFYIYDFNEYKKNRGLNVDIYKEMGQAASEDINKIIHWIETNQYDIEKLRNFRDKYVETLNTDNTQAIAHQIISLIQED